MYIQTVYHNATEKKRGRREPASQTKGDKDEKHAAILYHFSSAIAKNIASFSAGLVVVR